MRTYTEYLNSLTVKTLNSIARMFVKADGSLLNGYSKLRKAELVALIDSETTTLMPIILDVAVEDDQPEIVKIMATVAPVAFSAAPVKAPESAPKPAPVATLARPTNPYAAESTDELIEAYRNMRATQHNARGITHAKIEARLARMERVLKSRKVNMREV